MGGQQADYRLGVLQEFVQATADDFLHREFFEIVAEALKIQFGRLGVHRLAALAADAAQGAFEFAQAVAQGAREAFRKDKEFGHLERQDFRDVEPAIGFQGAGRAQHGLPLGRVHGAAHVGGPRQEDVVLDVEDTCRLVRALEVFAEADELPAFGAGEGGICQPLEEMREALDLVVKGARPLAPDLLGIAGLEEEIDLVEHLPHFERDLVAHLAGVLARRAHTTEHRVRIVPAECHELGHRGAVGLRVVLEKEILVSRRAQNRDPVLLDPLAIDRSEIDQQLYVHIDQARDVLGALEVARHPVKRGGHPR